MKNKKEKIIVLIILSLSLMTPLAESRIVPNYGNFTLSNDSASFLEQYVDYTLPSGVQKIKNRMGSYDNNKPFKMMYYENTSVHTDEYLFETLFNATELINEIGKGAEFSCTMYGIFNFAGAIRDFNIILSVFMMPNGTIKFTISMVYQTLSPPSFVYMFQQQQFNSYEFLYIRFCAGMIKDGEIDRNYGVLKSTISFVNLTSSIKAINVHEYEFWGHYSANENNCFIQSFVGFSQFYLINITSSSISANPCKFARSVFLNDNNPNSFVLPEKLYLENLAENPLTIEPEIPDENREYWLYNSFELTVLTVVSRELKREYKIYNDTTESEQNEAYSYSYNLTYYQVTAKENKYYYDSTAITPESWGNWVVKIYSLGGLVDYEISFNWMRNLLVLTVNAIVFLFQFIFYLLTIAFNYLIVWLFLNLFVLVYNYPVNWAIVAFIGIIFYLSFFFIWLWNQIVILWKQIIEPLLNWIWNETVAILRFLYNWLFKEGGLQTLVNLYLTLASYVLAAIFFVLTAGLINFTETQQAMAEFLIQLNSLFFQIGSIFISNFPLLIGYSGVYILLVGLVYLKYIYAKARGYTQRATKLQSMINVYKLPMVLLIRLSQYVIGFIQGGIPTDGADE